MFYFNNVYSKSFISCSKIKIDKEIISKTNEFGNVFYVGFSLFSRLLWKKYINCKHCPRDLSLGNLIFFKNVSYHLHCNIKKAQHISIFTLMGQFSFAHRRHTKWRMNMKKKSRKKERFMQRGGRTPQSKPYMSTMLLQSGGPSLVHNSIENAEFNNKQRNWKTGLNYQASKGDSKVRGNNLTQARFVGKKTEERRTFGEKHQNWPIPSIWVGELSMITESGHTWYKRKHKTPSFATQIWAEIQQWTFVS